MANMVLKHFTDGDKLPAKDLNNNFAVIEECINSSEKGLSTYERALKEGFEGSEDAWLSSLRGPQGETGVKGPKGNAAVTAGGHIFLWADSASNVQGYSNNVPMSEIYATNMNAQILEKEGVSYLSIDVENISRLEMYNYIAYYDKPVTDTTANLLEYIVDVYNDNMDTLLSTYKKACPVTKHIEFPVPIFGETEKTCQGPHHMCITIDTSSLNTINLVMKVNALKSDDSVVSEGTMKAIMSMGIFLEGFA